MSVITASGAFGRNALRGGGLVGLLAAALLLLPGNALAAENVQIEPVPGPIPQELIDEFANCPNEFEPEVLPFLCANIDVTGNLKLGHVESSIDEPMQLSLAIGIDTSDFSGVILAAEGDAPQPVPVSGGILGIPALDPILELEPLGLLTLSVPPNMGEVDAGGVDPFTMLNFLGGQYVDMGGQDVELGVPLSLKLKQHPVRQQVPDRHPGGTDRHQRNHGYERSG